MNELMIGGKRIEQDDNGYLSLNDIWDISGRQASKAPRFWLRILITKELLAALDKNVSLTHIIENSPNKSGVYARRGRRGQTFAHVIIALAYAEYLNPALGIEVRQIALRFWSGDVSLLDDFVRNLEARAQEDGGRVEMRESVRDNNSVLQFRILYGLGARSPRQYADFHNAGYEPLYDGENEDAIKKRKGLGPKQDILDYMNFPEMAANMFRTALTQDRLANEPVRTIAEACAVHGDMARLVRATLVQARATMPEDQPNVDSIANARKRLKNYAKAKKLK